MLEFDSSQKEWASDWISKHQDLVKQLTPLIKKSSNADNDGDNKILLGKLQQHLEQTGLDAHGAESVANELLSRYTPFSKSDYDWSISTAYSSPW